MVLFVESLFYVWVMSHWATRGTVSVCWTNCDAYREIEKYKRVMDLLVFCSVRSLSSI